MENFVYQKNLVSISHMTFVSLTNFIVRARAKPEREHLLQQIITNSLLGVEMTIFEGSAKSAFSLMLRPIFMVNVSFESSCRCG